MAATIVLLASASCTRETAQLQVQPIGIAKQGPALAQGQMLAGRGEHALAIDAFRKAVRADPEDVGAYRGLAASYDAIGRFDLGGRYHELALALAPRDPALREEMARSLERQDRRADADALRREFAEAATAEPVARGQVVTMDIVDVPPRSMTARLERVSMAETVLVTDIRPASAQPASLPTPVRAPALAPTRVSASSSIPASLPVPAPSTRVAAAPIKVMNAVGRRGQAARMRSHLLRSGWPAIETGDYAERIEQSRLIAPPALRGDAAKVVSALPFKVRVYTSPQAARMILVLGANAVRFDERLRGSSRL